MKSLNKLLMIQRLIHSKSLSLEYNLHTDIQKPNYCQPLAGPIPAPRDVVERPLQMGANLSPQHWRLGIEAGGQRVAIHQVCPRGNSRFLRRRG